MQYGAPFGVVAAALSIGISSVTFLAVFAHENPILAFLFGLFLTSGGSAIIIAGVRNDTASEGELLALCEGDKNGKSIQRGFT